MRSILNKRKREKAGFTLSETLIAILILLMVSAIVAGAIPAASNVYVKTVDAANAQLLLSTTMTVLRDELGTATSIKVEDASTITYRSGKNGCAKIQVVSTGTDPGLYIWHGEYKDGIPDFTNSTPRLLVSKKAATEGMVVSCTFSESGGVVTVSDLSVKKDMNKDGTPEELAGRTSYKIRPVA